MKKKVITAIILVSLPLFITACTLQDLPGIGKFFKGKVSPGGGAATLTMWGLWENPEIMNTLGSNYSEANPNISINYEDRSIIKPDEYKEIVMGRLAQEQDVPDVVLIHNTWVTEMQKLNLLEPMPSKLMDTQTYSSRFYPVAVQSAVFDGKIILILYFWCTTRITLQN